MIFMRDLTIDEIVTRSIPLDYNCSLKDAQAKVRREKLKQLIEAYTAQQLSNQFNAVEWKESA